MGGGLSGARRGAVGCGHARRLVGTPHPERAGAVRVAVAGLPPLGAELRPETGQAALLLRHRRRQSLLHLGTEVRPRGGRRGGRRGARRRRRAKRRRWRRAWLPPVTALRGACSVGVGACLGLLRARAGALGLGLGLGLQSLGSEARRRTAILRAIDGATRVSRAAARESVQGSRPPLGLWCTHLREGNVATEEGGPLLRLLRLLWRRWRRRWRLRWRRLRRRWLSGRCGLARRGLRRRGRAHLPQRPPLLGSVGVGGDEAEGLG